MSDDTTEAKVPFPKALAHLKPLSAWVIWRWVPKPKKPGEFDKPPFQPRFPDRLASNKNPKHWSDFKTAIAAKRAGKADGVGFIVSQDGELVYVDLDDCRNPETGSLSDWAKRYLSMYRGYAEVTPSGKGIRLIGRLTGPLAEAPIHRTYKGVGGAKGEIFYRATRYITITGKRIEGQDDALYSLDEIVSAILAESHSTRNGAGISQDRIADDDPDDPLLDLDTRAPLRLSHEQIRDYLAALPPDDAVDPVTGSAWWNREKWLYTIFAVHDDTDGSEEGYALIDEWCSKSAHYDPDGLRKTWDSARGSNGGEARISLRYLERLVRDWTRPQREAKLDDLLARMARAQNRQELEDCAAEARLLQIDSALNRALLVAQYRTAFRRITATPLGEAAARKELAYRDPNITDMPRWLRSFVWVTGTRKFYDAHTGQDYLPETFDLTFGSRFMSKEEIAQGLEQPPQRPSLLALNRYKVPHVAGIGYRPLKDSQLADDDLDDDAGGEDEGPARIRKPRIYIFEGKRYVNTYNTRGAVPAIYGPWTDQQKDDIRTIKALYLRICGNERDRDILFSLFRHILVERTRVRFCPLFCSAEGSGKTTGLHDIPVLLFGRDNVGVIPGSAVLDKTDQSWMTGHIYKVIEELWVPESAKTAVIERLKPVITNPTVAARLMYVGVQVMENTASYVALTNHDDVLALTTRDTRFYPIQPAEGVQTARAMAATLAADPDFYKRVRAAIERSIGAFRGWLETKFEPHPDFYAPNGRAPESMTKAQVIEEARDPLEREISDILAEDRHPLLSQDVVCLKTLMAKLRERSVPIIAPHGAYPEKVVAHALKRLDFASRGRMRVRASQGVETDDLAEGERAGDNRTRIYTSGASPLDRLGRKPTGQDVDDYVDRGWL